jgi:predicted nucleic acid-binding protein
MIILDTNVLSELMNLQPDKSVVFWIGRHQATSLFITTRKIGRPISQIDAQIAAIARRHNATLATRNVDDFTECDIDIVDPWK